MKNKAAFAIRLRYLSLVSLIFELDSARSGGLFCFIQKTGFRSPDDFLKGVKMSRTMPSVQNEMWNQLRKTHCPVTIYLCNGARLARVVIVSFDMYAVTVRTDGETHLVCKSNIATVLPEMKRPPARSPFRRIEAPSRAQPAAAPTPAPVVTIKRSTRRLPSFD